MNDHTLAILLGQDDSANSCDSAIAQARAIVARWRQGEEPDAHDCLRRFPHLRSSKAAVLDLAYEEFCLRLARGQPIDPNQFSTQFPFQNSLRTLLGLHDYVHENQGLLQDAHPTHAAPGLPIGVQWPKPGDKFLRFSLSQEVGRGGFARVFLATEPELGGRTVVVKLSPRGAAEAETLGRLQHRNIALIHSVDHDSAAKLTAVCMAYMGSATLEDVVRRVFRTAPVPRRAEMILDAVGRPALPEALAAEALERDPFLARASYADGVLHLVAQLAEALDYTHSQGVCHGDLKPSNVLLTPGGRPLLLDFNLSFDPRLMGRACGGTLGYMAPEQLLVTAVGQSDQTPPLDSLADLFSLGVILYELLSGSLPFGPVRGDLPLAQAAAALLDRQALGPIPLRHPQVDHRFARLVYRCLAFDPAERFQSAGELAAALRDSLRRRRRAWRWTRCHRIALFTAAASLLLSCGGAAFYLNSRPPYSLRQFRLGLQYYEAGAYREAVDCFDRTLTTDASLTAEAHFAKGRAHQQLEKFGLALENYREAENLVQDGRIMACAAYCLNRSKLHEEAIAKYEEAIRAGFATAEVFNNLGYSHLQLDNFDQTTVCLDRATELNPRLQAAFHNRALRDLKLSLRKQQLPLSGLRDIQAAIESGPANTDLYRDAARLYALAARHEPRYATRAIEFAAMAIERGQNPTALAAESFMSAVRGDQRFLTLLERPVSSNAPTKAVLLLDPLRDLAEPLHKPIAIIASRSSRSLDATCRSRVAVTNITP